MAKNKTKSLPPLGSLDEIVAFFDTHDLGDYWDELPEAHFDVDLPRQTHLVAIDAEVADQLTAIARSRQTSSEGLINSWLREKIQEQAQVPA